jgi:predicted dehydrogenase
LLHEPPCDVVTLAGTDPGQTAELARAANVVQGFGGWRTVARGATVSLVAIAVPPAFQPAIAQRALDLGKPVFLESLSLPTSPAPGRFSSQSGKVIDPQ